MRSALFAALLAAAPAGAQFRAAPARVPFVPAYLGTVSLSMGSDPFYSSRLLNAFQDEVARVAAAPTPLHAAEGLKARIEGPGRVALPEVAKGLGVAPLEPARAAAVLAANALARPDQFQEVVSGLEAMKPGLGTRVADSLRALGRKVTVTPEPLTYDARGVINAFFDATK